MKKLKNDNRMVIPLALIAVLFSGTAVMRVVKASQDSSTPQQIRANENPSVKPENSESAPAPKLDIPDLPRPNRDPFWHPTLKMKGASEQEALAQSEMPGGALPKLGSEPDFDPHKINTPFSTYKPNPSDKKRIAANTEINQFLYPTEQKTADYRLQAVIIGESPMAIIVTEKGETLFLHIGDKLPGDGASMPEVVVAIDAQSVILSTMNAMRRIVIEDKAAGNPASEAKSGDKTDAKPTTE